MNTDGKQTTLIDTERCDYCHNKLDEYELYSIPINSAMTQWYGQFCSQPCRLSANKYMCNQMLSPQNLDFREQLIRKLDQKYVEYAPPPEEMRDTHRHQVYRQQVISEKNRNNKIK